MQRYAVTFLRCRPHKCSSSHWLWTQTSVRVSDYQHHSRGCKTTDNHGKICRIYCYHQACNIMQAFVSLFTLQAYCKMSMPISCFSSAADIAILIKRQNQYAANTNVPAELLTTNTQPYFSGTARYSPSSKIHNSA